MKARQRRVLASNSVYEKTWGNEVGLDEDKLYGGGCCVSIYWITKYRDFIMGKRYASAKFTDSPVVNVLSDQLENRYTEDEERIGEAGER